MLFTKPALLAAALAAVGLAGCASDYDYGYRGAPDYYYTGPSGVVVEHDNYYYNHHPGYWDHQAANDAAYRDTLHRQEEYRQGLLRQQQVQQNHQSNEQLQRDIAAKRAAEAHEEKK